MRVLVIVNPGASRAETETQELSPMVCGSHRGDLRSRNLNR